MPPLPLLLKATQGEWRYKERSACSLLDEYPNQFKQVRLNLFYLTLNLLENSLKSILRLNLP
jgi:hypothetical protein